MSDDLCLVHMGHIGSKEDWWNPLYIVYTVGKYSMNILSFFLTSLPFSEPNDGSWHQLTAEYCWMICLKFLCGCSSKWIQLIVLMAKSSTYDHVQWEYHPQIIVLMMGEASRKIIQASLLEMRNSSTHTWRFSWEYMTLWWFNIANWKITFVNR